MSLTSADTVITGLLRTPEGDHRPGAVAVAGGTITDVIAGDPGRIDGRHVDVGAAAFMIEHAPAERRGMYASWLQATLPRIFPVAVRATGLAIS